MSRRETGERSPSTWGGALVYAVLTAWWVWPLPQVAATQRLAPEISLTGGADYYLIIWAMAWVSHALVTAPWNLFAANSFYPSTFSLAYSEHFIGHQPIFGPLYLLTGNPVLSGNVVLAGGQFLCAVAMYALARRFVSAPAAFVAGAFYAFCPLRYRGVEHFHILGVQYLPLVLLFTERWLERARRGDLVLLTASLVVQTLSSIYLAYATVLLYGAYLPLALGRWCRRLDARRVVGLATAGMVTLGFLVVTSLPYLKLRELGIVPSYGEGAHGAPLGLWTAPLQMRSYLQRDVGWVAYGLALAALVPPFGRRGWPAIMGVVAVAVGTLVGTGHALRLWGWSIPTPYPVLLEWLPGFATIRVPVRFALVTQLGLSLLAALGTARVLAWAPGVTRWPGAVLLVGTALWSLGPWTSRVLEPEPVGSAVPPAYRWLAEHGEGRVLLELPATSLRGRATRMFLSTVHWLPTVGGYSAYVPQTARYVERLGARLPADDALQAIVDAVDVGWILVHLHELPRARGWTRLPDGLSEAARWDDALLLRVTRRGDPVRQARLLSSRETLEGLPLEPVGEHCPGRIELDDAPPASARPGQTLRIGVRIHNDGQAPWPAFGFVPRHLVHLRVCVAAAGSPCRQVPQFLSADVHPGRSVRVAVPVRIPPRHGGESLLRLELEQEGDGPLSRCGVMPLTVPIMVSEGPPPGRP